MPLKSVVISNLVHWNIEPQQKQHKNLSISKYLHTTQYVLVCGCEIGFWFAASVHNKIFSAPLSGNLVSLTLQEMHSYQSNKPY